MNDALAIFGGRPAKRERGPGMYPGANMIDEQEEQAVLAVIRSRNLFRNYGPTEPHAQQVTHFEEELAAFLGVPHVIAVNSGTSALMAGLAALGIGPGDEVIVPAYTWIATANAVVLHGAVPVVAEVDDSLTLDPTRLSERISPRTKAIIPVHMQGMPSDMAAILDIARQHGLLVLEDTAQAMGGSFRGRKLGTWGDVGTFSLQTNKVITAGEGGAVAVRDEARYARAAAWHDGAGIWARDAHRGFSGENYRMGELAGAVARVQLTKLPRILARMRQIKMRMMQELEDLNLPLRRAPDREGDAAVAYTFFAPSAEQARAWSRALDAENIENWVAYRPDHHDEHVYAHWTPILRQLQAHPGRHPWADPSARRVTVEDAPQSLELLGRAIFVPCNPAFSDDEVGEVIAGIRKVVTLLKDPAHVS
jgi:8-amino-3,8-dideoxy-alpha-D-manno-octulosonate transaminase